MADGMQLVLYLSVARLLTLNTQSYTKVTTRQKSSLRIHCVRLEAVQRSILLQAPMVLL